MKANWDAIKTKEKAERAARRGGNGAAPSKSILDEVPVALPALTRAVKLQRRAGKVGFDWNDPRAVIAKIREEISEIEHELSRAEHDADRIEDEPGDILFAVCQPGASPLGRTRDGAAACERQVFSPLRSHIERELERQGRPLAGASLDEMEALWVEAKTRERDA